MFGNWSEIQNVLLFFVDLELVAVNLFCFRTTKKYYSIQKSIFENWCNII